MFQCVNCGHEDSTFHLEVAGNTEGAFLYRAKCPICGSRLVNVLPGPAEASLRITMERKKEECPYEPTHSSSVTNTL